MKHRIFVCACLLLCVDAPHAAPDLEASDAYRDNAQRLSMLVADAEAANDPQRLRTPEAKTLIAALSDHERILAGEPDPDSALETALGICDLSNWAVMSLVLFDLKEGVEPSGDQRRMIEDVARVMSRNLLFFQDELKQLQPFLFRCQARMIPSMQRFIAALPREELTEVRRGGIVKMRRGIAMAYQSATVGVFDGGIREDYRLAILSTLAETAETFATVMPPGERKAIARSARATAARVDKRYEKDLQKIASAFDREVCETLCAIE
ncbi:MAG: hypothetical protein E6Q88_08130 [Lysobacteraceae bacterium]|nr:MAG: hypothetical protein E6Q88_08130 [Xanthomonadaceae bacterium]